MNAITAKSKKTEEVTKPATAPRAVKKAVMLPVGANYKDGTKKAKTSTSSSPPSTKAAPKSDDNNVLSGRNTLALPPQTEGEPERSHQIVPPEKYHNWKRHLYNGCDEVREGEKVKLNHVFYYINEIYICPYG